MALYTKDYLRGKYNSTPFTERTRLFSKTINESQKAYPTFDIFLSHSFLDKEDVYGLYMELTELGYTVYVDWVVDSQLDRTNVTKESVMLIRNRMKVSKALLLAISENASISRWMPWELGFIDGQTGNCAIVPVSDKQIAPSSYKGSEYLSAYPYISKVSDFSSLHGKLVAVEEASKFVELNEMIKGTRPFLRTQKLF